MPYVRKISPVEWSHAANGYAAHSLFNRLINQWVIQGRGTFAVDAWQAAVHRTAQHTPGCRVIKKGYLGLSTWRDCGPLPRITLIQQASWDGMSGTNAPFLDTPLDIDHGPTCEIVLVECIDGRAFVVFRTHHAIMDGAGTTLFAKHIFKSLNRLDYPSASATLTEPALVASVKSIQPPAQQIVPNITSPFTHTYVDQPYPVEQQQARQWRRLSVQGTQNSILQQVLLALAAVTREHRPTAHLRFLIPTDMRRHANDVASTANLTGGIIVDVDSEDTVYSLKKKIARKLKHNEDFYRPKYTDLLVWIPLSLMSWIFDLSLKAQRKRRNKIGLSAYNQELATLLAKSAKKKSIIQLFANVSGLVSNIGYFSSADFSCPGFTMDAAFVIPVNGELAGFTTIASHANGNEIAISASREINETDFNAVVDQLQARLLRKSSTTA